MLVLPRRQSGRLRTPPRGLPPRGLRNLRHTGHNILIPGLLDENIPWVHVRVHKVVQQQHFEVRVDPQGYNMGVEGVGVFDEPGDALPRFKRFHQYRGGAKAREGPRHPHRAVTVDSEAVVEPAGATWGGVRGKWLVLSLGSTEAGPQR